MIGFFKISFPILFLFLFFGIKIFNVDQQNEVKHKIKIIHPGISLTDSVECILTEIKNEKGQPLEYYMDVESVVCGDAQCKIDIVRIFWDSFGYYDRLVLPKNVELEKEAGKHFTKEDYEKLNKILSDENSPLKEVYKEEIVGTIGSEGVDAMTGATILLEKYAYVKGAAWTCYSLWHWVHSDVKDHMRNITGDACSIGVLQDYLFNKHEVENLFALEQLTRRKGFSEKTIPLTLTAISKNNDLLKKGLDYFKHAPAPIFESSILQLLNSPNAKNRILVLNAILKYPQKLSPIFFQKIITQNPEITFQEINLFLEILKNKKAISPEIISQLIPFLENKNFLIARRVYWFLSEQNLNENQQNMLDDFFKKNKKRL